MVELPAGMRLATASQTLAAVARAREAEAESWPAAAISISAIANPCDRRIWLTLRWFAKPASYDAEKLRLFERGRLEEARVVAELRQAGFEVEDLDPATGRQWKAILAGGWLRGRVDGLVAGLPEAPTKWHVLEIKTLGAAAWRKVVDKGAIEAQPDHYAQAQLYMAALGFERTLYWAVNRDTDQVHAERWRHDQSVSDPLIERAERIAQALDMPAQVARTPKHPACSFCPFTAVCHAEPEARAWPASNCRTCVHFEPRGPYRGHCSRWGQSKDLDAQKAGCPAHVTEPTMIPAEQIDAAIDGSWIEYRLPNGEIWRDSEEGGWSPFGDL